MNRPKPPYRCPVQSLLIACLLGMPSLAARADIHHAGSKAPLPGTAGVSLAPGVDLSNWNSVGHTLNFGNFQNAPLAGALFTDSDLQHALFNKANLSTVNFNGAALKNARFNGATISGADFASASGFTFAQLRSTADFADHTLQNITLSNLDFHNGNFTSQNLAGSSFVSSALKNANFKNANLAGVNFQNATLSRVSFAHAIITGADFQGTTGFTAADLYSTASYASKTLGPINLYDMTLNNWNFAGQNMSGAAMGGVSAVNANFAGATLASASFYNALQIGGGGGPIYVGPITLGGDQPDEEGSNLTGANFSNANLSGTSFQEGTLTNANFAGATITNANFQGAINFTASQLYSTASYSAMNLGAINLYDLTMNGWNFAGQNMSSAAMGGISAINANFAGANLTNASFYNIPPFGPILLPGTITLGGDQPDAEGSNLTGANFAGANLTSVDFHLGTLTNANFAGSLITSADLSSAIGFSAAQLYSTASYANHNLRGISFGGDDLTGWNFTGQDLANASFEYAKNPSSFVTFQPIQLRIVPNDVFVQLPGGIWQPITILQPTPFPAILANANFTRANLAGARFDSTVLTNTNFSDADLRGATGFAPLSSTITSNAILPDGSIHGLALTANETLTIRNNVTPITISTTATLDPQSTLQFLLSSNWTSTISFASGLTPTLAGTLDLEIAPGINPAFLIGQTLKLFTWNAPLDPGDHFTSVATDPALTWDLTNLYTTGQITLVATQSAGSASPVPEPASLAVVLTVVPFLLKRRRKL